MNATPVGTFGKHQKAISLWQHVLPSNPKSESSVYGFVVPAAATGASFVILFVIVTVFLVAATIGLVCFFKKKKTAVSDVGGPSIVIYPSNRGSCPQFITKDILFNLPPSRRFGSLKNLTGELDSETETLLDESVTRYGRVDPALYRGCGANPEEETDYSEDHIGRLWFSVRYEPSAEKLLVWVSKAENLPSRAAGTANGCDPFVRLYLLPDERRHCQAKTKRRTCNPFFDETFVFQVPPKELADHCLKLTVVDSGRAKRRAVIGHVSLHLKNSLAEMEPKLFKMDLEKEEGPDGVYSSAGELLISLLYNESLNRLGVTVVEGRNIKFKNPDKQDCYVKVTLGQNYRAAKVKKTTTVRGSNNPNFSERFNFRVTPEAADVNSLTFELFQSVSGYGKDKLIGRFVLGSHMFARGKGNVHWTSAFLNPKEDFRQWHALLE